MPPAHLLPFLTTIVALSAWAIPAPCFCANCKQNCGNLNIIFPFYLQGTTSSNGMPVCGLLGYELECRGSRPFIALGLQKYEVLDLQAGALRIDPNPSNSCPADNLKSFHLFNTTFRLHPHNLLQLYDCNRACNDCSIPLPVNHSLSHPLRECAHSHPRCCETLDLSSFDPSIHLFDFTAGYQSLQNYSSYFGCSSFSSWAYSSADGGVLSFLTEYGLMLEWFIRGNCSSCSSNAICNSTAPDHGYTCKCGPHYSGDGYAEGSGCHSGKSEASGRNQIIRSRSPLENALLMSGVVTAAFFLGVGMVCGVLLFRKKRERLMLGRSKGASFRNIDVNGLALLLSSLELFTYKQLDKATKGFASSEKLGNGASGAVYAAKLEDGRRAAVKRLHHFNTHLGYQQTLNELSVLSTVKHRNLVRLLGCCAESPEPLLVFEYVSNGTLAEHLQRERGDGLDWLTRLSIAAEAADALAYLHSMDPPIFHRDVKSRNILLDHEYNTKIADFGLSRTGPTLSCDGSHISTIPQGTPGYLDPEYHQNFHLSSKSDVYSFGVVLIEMITALKPVDFSREKREVNLAGLAVAKITAGCLDDIIDPLLHANERFHVKSMVQRVAELAFRCLAYDKDARPPMTEVLEELLLIRGSAIAPIVDAAEDDQSEDSLWMDAHSSRQNDSGFSLSLLETDRCVLLARPQRCGSNVEGRGGTTSSENV